MTAEELVLNIGVNMGRLSTWVSEQKLKRVDFFLEETERYLKDLQKTEMKDRFLPTYKQFAVKFNELKNNLQRDNAWAEDALTWANILIHRAKLA